MSSVEIVTDALVLEKTPWKDEDFHVTLYTKALGKVMARATSARKMTSKLNAHLEPLCVVVVRLMQKSAEHNAVYQLGDALARETIAGRKRNDVYAQEGLSLLAYVNQLTPFEESDDSLWQFLHAYMSSDAPLPAYKKILLNILGFDATFASCRICAGAPSWFNGGDDAFYCDRCINRVEKENKSLMLCING